MSTIPIYALVDTWDNVGTTFKGIALNVTDTASASGSLLMDLQVGGVSRFKVDKNGYAFVSPGNGSLNQHGINFIGRSVGISAPNNTVLRFGRDNSADMIVTYTLGSEKFVLKSSMPFGWATLGADAANDLQLHRDAADTLAQRRGVNAQAFRVYNTFTDASNYERGKMEWASNVLKIGTEKAGTGTARALELQTDGVTRLTIASGGGVSINGTTLSATFGITSTNGGIQASNSITAAYTTAIPAGGLATRGLKMSSTADFGVFFGSGAPTLSAAQGSLYLRSDGTTTNDRMYVNTDGATTWTAVTTAA